MAVNVVEDLKELEANPSLQHFLGSVYEYDSIKKRRSRLVLQAALLLLEESADVISLPLSFLSILRRHSTGI